MPATAEPVIDSPEFVFRNWTSDVLNDEFMDYAQADLTDPAVVVMNQLLTEEWRVRGFRMIPIHAELFSRIANLEEVGSPVILPAGEHAREVWESAVERLDFDDIVAEAGLTREYAAFVRAQPDYNH